MVLETYIKAHENKDVDKILDIIDGNMAIVDEELENKYWTLSEEKYRSIIIKLKRMKNQN